jgi:hypothetical protein
VRGLGRMLTFFQVPADAGAEQKADRSRPGRSGDEARSFTVADSLDALPILTICSPWETSHLARPGIDRMLQRHHFIPHDSTISASSFSVARYDICA